MTRKQRGAKFLQLFCSYDASMLDHSMQMKQISSPSETDVFSYPLVSVSSTKIKQGWSFPEMWLCAYALFLITF